jgi:hypothetical protein
MLSQTDPRPEGRRFRPNLQRPRVLRNVQICENGPNVSAGSRKTYRLWKMERAKGTKLSSPAVRRCSYISMFINI